MTVTPSLQQTHLRRPPGPIAVQAAALAKANADAHIVEHGGNNLGPEVENYQRIAGAGKGDPWCMAFVFTELWKAAGEPKGYQMPMGFPRTASTLTAAAWGKGHMLWTPVAFVAQYQQDPHQVVAAGDLAFFYLYVASEKRRRIAHVGIVVGVGAHGVTTVEGNTGPASGSVNREGDGVYQKWRDWRELGELGGFVRLPF